MMSLPAARRDTRSLVLSAAGAVYMAVIVLALLRSPNLATGLVVLHVLLLLSAPLLLWATRDEDPVIARIIVAGFVLKLVGSLARYVVAFTVYGGRADAAHYDSAGAAIAAALRAGETTLDLGGSLIGTRFIELLTGIVYTVTGRTMIGGFIVFSWFGFLGLLLFYRAFRMVFPGAMTARRRYAALVFLMPSLLFWPSSIGKEAWMCLMLGLCAYGLAGVLTQRARGVPAVLAGLAGATLVRPHIAAAVLLGAGTAVFIGRRRKDAAVFTRVGVAAMLVVLVASALMLGRAQTYFEGKTGGSSISLNERLQSTVETTSGGGSSFTPVSASNPLELPVAAFSVLFRPLPFEASNPMSLLASIEGTGLLLWIFYERRALYQTLRQIRSHRYVVFSAAYVALFCLAFSSIGNFGILVRERVQVLPFLLIMFCTPNTYESGENVVAVESAETRAGTGAEPARQ